MTPSLDLCMCSTINPMMLLINGFYMAAYTRSYTNPCEYFTFLILPMSSASVMVVRCKAVCKAESSAVVVYQPF